MYSYAWKAADTLPDESAILSWILAQGRSYELELVGEKPVYQEGGLGVDPEGATRGVGAVRDDRSEDQRPRT